MNLTFMIKLPYWIGAGVDALWAVALFYPPVFGYLTCNPSFSPSVETRLIMGIGGSLMTGWTLLLLWAVRKPIERRVILLLTACPVVLGMLIVSIIGQNYSSGDNTWIIYKTVLLLIIMTWSYFVAKKRDKNNYK